MFDLLSSSSMEKFWLRPLCGMSLIIPSISEFTFYFHHSISKILQCWKLDKIKRMLEIHWYIYNQTQFKATRRAWNCWISPFELKLRFRPAFFETNSFWRIWTPYLTNNYWHCLPLHYTFLFQSENKCLQDFNWTKIP